VHIIENRKGLLRGVLLGSACFTAAFLAVPAAAQDSGMETVVVTGIRGSLQKSLDIKRDSLGLTDAVTMEDIGKFPDSNLATAMMRIPGVTISRGVTSSNNIGSSTGEPSQITVRGFGPAYNETLFDGRKVSSGITGRAFDFSALNSDLVQQIAVLKSPDPTLSAGAIGATINIKYPKPLDNPGLKLTASASTTISPEEGRFTPNGNFLISDTFANDRVGFLLSGSYTESKTRVNQVSNWGWEGTYIDPCQLKGGPVCGASLTPDNTNPVWFTQDMGVYVMHDWQMREELRGALQFRPNESLEITIDGGFNRSDLKEFQSAYAIWNNVGEMRDITLSQNGTILNFLRKPGGAENNVPADFDGSIPEVVLQSYDFGINTKWNVSNNFTVTADLASSLSALSPNGQYTNMNADIGYGPSRTGGINGATLGMTDAAEGHVLPYFVNYGPGGDAEQFLNPNIIGSHVMVLQSQQNRNSVSQAKVQGTWEEDNLSVTGGFQYVGNHYKQTIYDNFTNNQWQVYSGYGPDSNNYYSPGMAAGVHLPAEFFAKTVSIGKDFIPGWTGGENLPPGLFVVDPRQVYNYLESLGDPASKTISGFNYGCCNPAYHGKISVVLNPSSWQQVAEDTFAGFISVTANTKVAGMPLKVHAGIRSEYTELETKGMGQLPTKLTVMSSDHTAFQVDYTDAQAVSVKNSYQYLLPNIDLNLEVTDDFHIRADASRTLTRPPLVNLNPVTTYSASERVGALVATGQNPHLMPYTSDNLDVSAEWYYGANSYLSADVFLKNATNFIITGTTTQTINGVIDPTTGQLAQWRVSAVVNGPNANIYGMELAWQHMFGETGFGYAVNATLVQTDRPYNPHDISTSNFAVTGLADSANLTAFYDKDGFEFRVAVNWRDSYLNLFGQYQPNSAFGSEPVFVNPSWSLDLSSRYDITDQITLYAEAQNLLDSTYSTRGRFPEQVLDVSAYGRRFTIGLHYKL
jgi:iron complex outermembrane recepter protein